MKYKDLLDKKKLKSDAKKDYKISVVIPCFNQEKYIQSCLDSIAKQKFDGLEIIIVDDGSTDLTKQKIEEYMASHDNLDICYYYQENAGPGVARNTALNNAHGKYIAFLDSDDKLPAGAYNALFYTAEKYESDIVIGEYFRRIDNGPWYVYDYIKQYCKDNEGKNCAGDYIVAIKNPSLWNRLFNLEFLDKNNIRFLPEMHGEDCGFNLDTIKYAKKIYTTSSIVYCYTKKTTIQGTLSTSWNYKNTSSFLNVLKKYATYFDSINDVYTEFTFFSTHFSYLLNGLKTITDSELQEKLFSEFKEVLALYKGNIRYQKFLELLLGVELDVVLEIPYKVYKSLLYKLAEKNKQSPQVVTKYVSSAGDTREQTLIDFRSGKIGFRYIWLYFKAWLGFKFKKK